ncbi:flippase-like domain-containing protein [Mariniblastus sp.]|nr:flippase-like domain-containing protein [Mariniblastus sp.]
MFSLTAAAIGYLIYRSADQLAAKQVDLSQIDYRWWAGAVTVYLISMLLSAFFWQRVLIAFGQQPKFTDSVAAFFTSQLGKYVPGKAMVVVIRTDMIRGDKVNTKPAAASVFVETLTWLFTGAAIASVLMIVKFQDHRGLQITAAVLTLIAGVLTWPSIFQKIATRLSSLGKDKEGKAKKNNVFAGLNLRTMSQGWLLLTIGWCFNGASLWMVIRGIPGCELRPEDYWLTLACVSLATVAGFVSLLPGGIGVRELVLIPLLGPTIGPANAIIAAIVIRLVWLASELLGAGGFWVSRFLRKNTNE